MANDELDLDIDLEEDVQKPHPVDKRIIKLNEKVRTVEEESAEKDRLLVQERAEKESLQKERDFLSSFGDTLGKYPNAASHRDEIKEKVLKGYSVEDATISTLAVKGELTPKIAIVDNPAGGSAATTQQSTDPNRSLAQMSREEKRTALLEAEQKGDIYIS